MLSRLEEIKLVSQCALADNRRAFGQLVEAYQPRLRRFLLNLTGGDVDLTDDLAQETFLKAYLNIRSFRCLSGFSTWLYRIAYNEFYSETRRHHEEAMSEFDQAQQPAATASTEAQLTIQAAMQALNHQERTVVTLFYIEDQPLKKICNIMQLPEGTVKSLLHRARTKMKETVEYQIN